MTNKQLSFILDCIKEKDKILGSMGWLDDYCKRKKSTRRPKDSYRFTERAEAILRVEEPGTGIFEIDLSKEMFKKVLALVIEDYECRLRAIEDALNGIETNLPNVPDDEKVQF